MATKKFNSDAKSHGRPSKSHYEIPAKRDEVYAAPGERGLLYCTGAFYHGTELMRMWLLIRSNKGAETELMSHCFGVDFIPEKGQIALQPISLCVFQIISSTRFLK